LCSDAAKAEDASTVARAGLARAAGAKTDRVPDGVHGGVAAGAAPAGGLRRLYGAGAHCLRIPCGATTQLPQPSRKKQEREHSGRSSVDASIRKQGETYIFAFFY